jgi:hypothetical protein
LPNLTQVEVALRGSPRLIGTITADASTAKDNSTTASTFAIPGGSLLLLESDAAFYFIARTAAGSTAVSATNGIEVATSTERIVFLYPNEQWIMVLSKTGTANVRVFTLG